MHGEVGNGRTRECLDTHAYVRGQSCTTPRSPVDCSTPGFSVYEIILARILEWAAIASSGDLLVPGTEPSSPVAPSLAGGFFSPEPPGKPKCLEPDFKNLEQPR